MNRSLGFCVVFKCGCGCSPIGRRDGYIGVSSAECCECTQKREGMRNKKTNERDVTSWREVKDDRFSWLNFVSYQVLEKPTNTEFVTLPLKTNKPKNTLVEHTVNVDASPRQGGRPNDDSNPATSTYQVARPSFQEIEVLWHSSRGLSTAGENQLPVKRKQRIRHEWAEISFSRGGPFISSRFQL